MFILLIKLISFFVKNHIIIPANLIKLHRKIIKIKREKINT